MQTHGASRNCVFAGPKNCDTSGIGQADPLAGAQAQTGVVCCSIIGICAGLGAGTRFGSPWCIYVDPNPWILRISGVYSKTVVCDRMVGWAWVFWPKFDLAG